MKKLIILIFIIFLANTVLYAAEKDFFIINAGISCIYPLIEDWSVAGNIFGSMLFSSLHAGAGVHLPIIPNILMPGIYGEANFWLLPLLLQYIFEVDDFEYSVLDIGARVYNLSRFGPFDIKPFVGINLSLLTGFSMTYGVMMALNGIGIEYTYLKPTGRQFISNSKAVHRFAIVFNMRY
ncbi:MAG: hypothetical protein FWD26_06685 [Treponema sp.]|nr:hypothetical protein [Treponema sp.]